LLRSPSFWFAETRLSQAAQTLLREMTPKLENKKMDKFGRLLAFVGLGLAVLSAAPAQATVLDLSTMTCQQFIESDKDTIAMVLTWMDGWYKGDEDSAIIDTEVFVTNAKKFGGYCAANPTISIVNAAEEILGK
jgi:acid stress chaperone HdeB